MKNDDIMYLVTVGDRIWIAHQQHGKTRTFELTGGDANILWIGDTWNGDNHG